MTEELEDVLSNFIITVHGNLHSIPARPFQVWAAATARNLATALSLVLVGIGHDGDVERSDELKEIADGLAAYLAGLSQEDRFVAQAELSTYSFTLRMLAAAVNLRVMRTLPHT